MKAIKSILSFLMGSILLLSPYFLYAQYKDIEVPFFDKSKKFSVSIYAMYVSSAELQNNIKSSVSYVRDASTELAGGYGYGGEITYDPGFYNSGVSFYLSSEYLKVKDDDLALRFEEDTNYASVRFTEEFSMIPIEGGLKWSLPVSTERFKIYIGGGAGVYFGKRTRSIGPYKSTNISKTPGFSLNVLAGTEYYIGRNLSVDFEFKFREASFEDESSFGFNYIYINGHSYFMDNPVHSRILVDGVRVSAGLKYNF